MDKPKAKVIELSSSQDYAEFWVKDSADPFLGFRVELSRGPAGISIRVDSFTGAQKLTVDSPGDTLHGMSACQYRIDAKSQAYKEAYKRGSEGLTEFHKVWGGW